MKKRCGTHQDLEYQMMLTNLHAANLSVLTLKSYKNVFYFCLFTEKKSYQNQASSSTESTKNQMFFM